MPTYQYICRDCDHAFDKRLRMSQAGETQSCPSCGNLNTRKRIGAIAVNGAGNTTTATMSAPPVSSPFS